MSAARRIDQVLCGFADGDAISHMAVRLRDSLRTLGVASEIFAPAEATAPSVRDQVRPLTTLRPAPGDALVHHYSIASPAVDAFLAAPSRKILIYHNITPESYFAPYADAITASLRSARAGLAPVARASDAVWTVSAFNAEELKSLGLPARVLPLPFDPQTLAATPEPIILGRFDGDALRNLLFVGRVAPNKRIEDLILAFKHYNETLDPYSRLLVVGSPRSCPKYFMMLRMYANEMNLPNVCFEGFASPEGLVAYYQVAHAFVCASAHEGYCLPLVEAMHMGVPVIARQAGGTPEALGGAGVLYEDLPAPELAHLWHRVLHDPALNARVRESQRARMAQLAARDFDAEVAGLLHAVPGLNLPLSPPSSSARSA